MVGARRRLALSALALGLAGTAVVPPAAGTEASAPAATPDQGTHPVASVEDIVVDLDRVGGGAESGPVHTEAADTQVDAFTMIGATYSSSATRPGRVRALVDGSWTRWFPLREAGTDADHGPDAGTDEGDRPASDPVWVADGEGFQLRLPVDARDVTVHLVRETEAPGGASEAAPAPSSPEAAAYRIPSVRPRSAWGAGPYHGTVDTSRRLRRAVIHHTVNGNGYSAAQVPSMLRSIQAYHQGSRGWDDIGYNFVIDRFGTIWEGRADSLYEPVIGAHAREVNTGSVGVAYLGDGSSAGLSPTAITNLGRFLGWKLRLHSSRPRQSNIGGHRDVGQSECPGNIVYGQLGSVRSRAIALQPPAGPFFDVASNAPLGPVLTWGRRAKIIKSLPDGTFHPERTMSRADSVYWLWRFAGRPPATVGHGFTDVPADAYYRNALRWARQRGIVQSSPNRRFLPGLPITREQNVVQLWRYVGSPDPSVDHNYTDVPQGAPNDVAFDWADAYGLVPTTQFGRAVRVTRGQGVQLLHRLRPYADVRRRHAFFADVSWARFHVIASGVGGNRFGPATAVSRGQAVLWLWRMMDRPAPTADHPFTDVADDDSILDQALDWAANAGWVEGLAADPSAFGPNNPLVRAKAATWVWRMAGSLAPTSEHAFNDVADDNSDLDRALDWGGTTRQIFTGVGGGHFAPAANMSRANLVRSLFRLAHRPGAWAVPPPSTVLF